jgi:hypothetical protein
MDLQSRLPFLLVQVIWCATAEKENVCKFVIVHNYRWRRSLAEEEPKYDDLEKRRAQSPVIGRPPSRW